MKAKKYYIAPAYLLLCAINIISSTHQKYILTSATLKDQKIVLKNNALSAHPLFKIIIDFNKKLEKKYNACQEEATTYATKEKSKGVLRAETNLFIPNFFDIHQLLDIANKPTDYLSVDETINMFNYIDFFARKKLHAKSKNIYIQRLYSHLITTINNKKNSNFIEYRPQITEIKNERLKNNILLFFLFTEYLQKHTTLEPFFKKRKEHNIIKISKNTLKDLTYLFSDNKPKNLLLLSKKIIAIPFLWDKKTSKVTDNQNQHNTWMLYDYETEEFINLIEPRVSSNKKYVWGKKSNGTGIIYDIENNTKKTVTDFFDKEININHLYDVFDPFRYILCIKKMLKNDRQFSKLKVVHNEKITTFPLVCHQHIPVPTPQSIEAEKVYYLTDSADTNTDFSITWIDEKCTIYNIDFTKIAQSIDKHLFMHLAWYGKVGNLRIDTEKNHLKTQSLFTGTWYTFCIKKIIQKNDILYLKLENRIMSSKKIAQNNRHMEKVNILPDINICYKNISDTAKSLLILQLNILYTKKMRKVMLKDPFKNIQYKDGNFMINIGKNYYIFSKEDLGKWLQNQAY